MKLALKDLLRLATIGSVDDGKSTLIGRLLVDTRQLFDDQLDAVVAASEKRGVGDLDLAGPEFAWVVLDPPGLGEDLLELPLRRGADGALMVKDNRARTGCPLIQSQNKRLRQTIQNG